MPLPSKNTIRSAVCTNNVTEAVRLREMSNLDQLESQRLQLEESVAKLRKSLQHWRTWDAEYEGLKEELQTSGDAESEEDCVCLGQNP